MGAARSLLKTPVEPNPPQFGRGSSRGQPPASNGIKCPGRLAAQGFRRGREDFCAAVRHKSNGIFPAVEKVQGLFRQPEGRPMGAAPFLDGIFADLGCCVWNTNI